MGSHKTVGVVFGWQKQKLHIAGITGKGQGAIQCLASGTPSCGVAIKAEHHRVGEAKQFLHMVGGASGTQSGYRVGKTQLGQGHHIHIPLSHQDIASFAQGSTRFKQAVQLSPFAEHRCFGGVEVFGCAVTEHTPTKAYALAFDIANGKHDAVAKAVVTFVFFATFFV